MTTCQICGREIKANTGTIAHHGYTRPGDGWQSASCFGAKYRPYEVSCDALEPAIKSISNFIENTKATLAKFLANPPATLTIKKRYPQRGTEEIAKPEGFKYDSSRSISFRDEYAVAYSSRKHQIETEIKSAGQQLKYMQERLANWKPATK